MKITLIGGSGFVGTRLIDLLKQTNVELENIDKQPSAFHSEITTIANVLDKEKITDLLKGTDLVVLLAAEHRDDVSPTSFYCNITNINHIISRKTCRFIARLSLSKNQPHLLK